ncbi:hypothetical protein BO78DRAFT_205291 [Aspergillus sclerotiicarbonarius CBS 121057]|uniref:Uncharacterized protein n=1 Tax=Aspergillus sclerotiicarbonarius (strain CBS 121057 / IBT 28362) TaxID=1448318 RepID=A0A319ES26_ASPSB|nr:hypothetical protein BO78DRAFT_205291 [Aspergillus sclerotiicarbonarius CBS 121057]
MGIIWRPTLHLFVIPPPPPVLLFLSLPSILLLQSYPATLTSPQQTPPRPAFNPPPVRRRANVCPARLTWAVITAHCLFQFFPTALCHCRLIVVLPTPSLPFVGFGFLASQSIWRGRSTVGQILRSGSSPLACWWSFFHLKYDAVLGWYYPVTIVPCSSGRSTCNIIGDLPAVDNASQD